ncbi:glycosidase, partial [bacterium]
GLSGTDARPESNKDGVLFPDRIDGKTVMLHRPMTDDIDTWQTAIAVADRPEGPFTDLGSVHGPERHAQYMKSWAGAGAVPIKIGPGRYVSIEHTGNFFPDGRRKYVLDAFLYDFNGWDPSRPETLVKARLDDFMRPETDFEVNGPFPESVGNVVFACGAYVHDGWLYLVYGGGDSFILAARMRFDTLIDALEKRVAHQEAVFAA